jgi:hypothetical protein
MKIVHLITQRDQPYGSRRLCCELCGEYGRLGDGTHFHTDEVDFEEKLPEGYASCRQAKWAETRDRAMSQSC